MKIKKGTLLKVNHSRKGKFVGIAEKDFDTDKTEFYPIALAQEKIVDGVANYWGEGSSIPCRNGLCEIEIKDNS